MHQLFHGNCPVANPGLSYHSLTFTYLRVRVCMQTVTVEQLTQARSLYFHVLVHELVKLKQYKYCVLKSTHPRGEKNEAPPQPLKSNLTQIISVFPSFTLFIIIFLIILGPGQKCALYREFLALSHSVAKAVLTLVKLELHTQH